MNDAQKINYKRFSNFLFKLNPYEYSTIAFIMGIIISSQLTTSEQNSLGNWLQLIGQTLETMSAQNQLLNPQNVNPNEYEAFKKDIYQKYKKLLDRY